MANDQSNLPETIRAFIALELSAPLMDALRAVQEQLQADLPKDAVRWVPTGQIHLTLSFLGNVPSDSLRDMEPGLQNVCQSCAPFRLRTEGLGCFPNPARPRIVWVGLGGDLDSLLALQFQIAQATRAWCERTEERTFRPHLTIGRVRDISPRVARQVGLTIKETSVATSGECQVEAVSLMRSRLTPQGAEHTLVASLPLGGDGHGH
jgi:2'-5' RNA ligase